MFLDAVEAVEDVGDMGCWDSFAVVCDVDGEFPVLWVGGGGDFDVESGFCVLFEGVFDDVEEGLFPVE